MCRCPGDVGITTITFPHQAAAPAALASRLSRRRSRPASRRRARRRARDNHSEKNKGPGSDASAANVPGAGGEARAGMPQSEGTKKQKGKKKRATGQNGHVQGRGCCRRRVAVAVRARRGDASVGTECSAQLSSRGGQQTHRHTDTTDMQTDRLWRLSSSRTEELFGSCLEGDRRYHSNISSRAESITSASPPPPWTSSFPAPC